MKVTNCPMCGGFVRAESVGWKCTNCRGFIDMQGHFHEHKNTPFMPPKTNADRIRAMSDEELASFLCSVNDDYTSGEGGKFIEGTIIIDYNEDAILEWLQQPAEGE